MPRTKQCDDIGINTLHHLQTCIFHPKQLDELFYVGQPCPHGHRYRHRKLHWCFNCALKIYANSCSADLSRISAQHRPYFVKLFEGLPMDRPTTECWELPLERCGRGGQSTRFSYINYAYGKTNRAVSMPLPRLTYALFWGEIGSVSVTSTCKNSRCWNPLHVKSRFNVKPTPTTIGPVNLSIDIAKILDFDRNPITPDAERTPTIRLIKSPHLNKQVDPGSPFRPLESQYVPELE